MKIIQITDLHVAREGEPSFGVDVRQNFLDALKAAKSLSPDLLVLTGDLCYDTADMEIYHWIKTQVDALHIPYSVIGGNHDSSGALASAFDAEHLLVGGELFYKRWLHGQCLFFLETSEGFVSEGQLLWLSHELSLLEKDTVIFMHHPPVLGGVPHMDINYPLQNIAEVQEVFAQCPYHLTIFCGHYHVEKTICLRNMTVQITPSTYFQIDSHTEGFKVDHLRPAFREINIRKDGSVESTVIYYEGNRLM
jgi:Icc protein